MEKIKEKQERMIKMKKINMMMNSNINKKKDMLNKIEMKLIKIKLHKILRENNNKICNKFKRKNNSFNKRLKKYFKSDNYINGKIIQENNFSPNKKEFYSSHNLPDFYFDLDSNIINDEEYITRAVVNSFTEREKKIISLSPKYFSINNNKALMQRLKIDPNETLKDKLLKEDNNNEKSKYKNSLDINNSTKNIIKNNKNYFDLNIKKIDKLRNKKYKEEKKNSIINKKNNITDYFNKEIKNYYNKFNYFCGKNDLFYHSWKGNDDYYKMFNYPMNYNMTKECLLDKNNERLDKEEYFRQIREKNKLDKDLINATISKYQAIMMKNYIK